MLFAGNLKEFDLLDFIKFLCSGKRTATIDITGAKPGKVFISGGHVIGVIVPDQVTQQFMSYLATIDEGEFSVLPTDTDQFPLRLMIAINTPLHEFLLELARLRANPPDPKLYDEDFIFELRPAPNIGKLSFSEDEWRIIAALSEQRKVNELSTRLGIPTARIQWILFSLEQAQLIVRKRPEKVKQLAENIATKLIHFLSKLKR